MTPDHFGRGARGIPWLVVTGVLIAALSLRGPIVAPTPVLRDIEADLQVGSAAAGLLTSAPVLMFALLTPVAALVIRRAGAERALLLSLVGVLAGTVVRALPGYGWMLGGMLLIGAAITVGNVVIPVIIRRDVPPARVAVVTAAYVAMLNAGSLLTSLLTAPIASAIGWPLALLSWSAITVAGALLWGVHLRRDRAAGVGDERYSGGEPDARSTDPEKRGAADSSALTGPLPVVAGRGGGRGLLRRPVTWLLLLAFGTQVSMYYALSTWLPTLVVDELGATPTQAGAIASIFHGAGIVGAFVVPLMTRFLPMIVPAATICVSWIVLTLGVLLAPELLWVWLAVGAIGHAGGFVVIFTTLVGAARSDREAAGMSAVIQGGGYGLGALGAPVMGALHESTGAWTSALVLMVVLAVLYAALLVPAIAIPRSRSR